MDFSEFDFSQYVSFEDFISVLLGCNSSFGGNNSGRKKINIYNKNIGWLGGFNDGFYGFFGFNSFKWLIFLNLEVEIILIFVEVFWGI